MIAGLHHPGSLRIERTPYCSRVNAFGPEYNVVRGANQSHDPANWPVQLFFGTSQSANLAVLNKDFMIGNSVNFGGGSTVTLVLPPLVVPPAAPGPTQGPAPVLPGPPTLPDASMAAGPPPLALGLVVLAAAGGFLVLVRPRRRS